MNRFFKLKSLIPTLGLAAGLLGVAAPVQADNVRVTGSGYVDGTPSFDFPEANRAGGDGGIVDIGPTAQFSLSVQQITELRRNGAVRTRLKGFVNGVIPFFTSNPLGIGPSSVGFVQFRSTRIDTLFLEDTDSGGLRAFITGRGVLIVGRRRIAVPFELDVLDNGHGGRGDRLVLSLISPLDGSAAIVGGVLQHVGDQRERGIINDIKIDVAGSLSDDLFPTRQ